VTWARGPKPPLTCAPRPWPLPIASRQRPARIYPANDRFYTHAADIDADLQAWMRFYNFERPDRGYRTKGPRPAEIFYADQPALLVMKGWDPDEFTPQVSGSNEGHTD
jgi:hypothetical protein